MLMTPTGILCYTCGIFIFCDYYKGDDILALAVLSILITAPLGAIGINYSAEKLL